MKNPKNKARRQKGVDRKRKPKLIKESNHDVWAAIENGTNFTDQIDFYDDSKEQIFYKSLTKNEDYKFLPEPYYNYAITTHGRVYSFKTSKYMRCLFQPNSCIITLNGNSNVRLKKLFEITGLEYNHENVVNELIKYKLINIV